MRKRLGCWGGWLYAMFEEGIREKRSFTSEPPRRRLYVLYSINYSLCPCGFDFFASSVPWERVVQRERREQNHGAVSRREQDGDIEAESERYLHAICILVDPYCFHLQRAGGGSLPPTNPSCYVASHFSLLSVYIYHFCTRYLEYMCKYNIHQHNNDPLNAKANSSQVESDHPLNRIVLVISTFVLDESLYYIYEKTCSLRSCFPSLLTNHCTL